MKETDLARLVGQRLATARKTIGISQTELARRVLGSSASQVRVVSFSNRISEWERGAVLPSAISLYRIARTLRLSIDWIVGLSDQ